MATNKPTIPVPGRLTSATMDGIVTGADEIYDDDLTLTLAEINAIVLSGNVTFSLTARVNDLTSAFVGTSVNVNLVATCSTKTNSIKIYKQGIENPIATGSGISLSTTHNLTPVEGDNNYTADAFVGSMPRYASAKIVGVLPVSYGAQATYSAGDLTQVTTPVTRVAGQYTMTLDSTRRFIYFKVPKRNVTGITSVGMGSGAEISPVNGSYISEDENYMIWKSTDGFTGNGPQVFTVS